MWFVSSHLAVVFLPADWNPDRLLAGLDGRVYRQRG
jgi:hypothetical protein